MKVVVNFGHRLKVIRASRKLSQEKLAELSGLHRTYISSVERGDRNPTLVTLGKLASALDMDISEMLHGVTNE